jgi:archaellum component FlaC
MNFSPLEKSAAEAAAEIYKLAERIDALTSKEAEEALKELNNLGFENVTRSLEKLGVALGNVGAKANTEGIDKLKDSLSDFPDASGIFDGIDFDAVNAQFTNISTHTGKLKEKLEALTSVVVGINVALKDVNDNLGDFQQKAQDASGDMADLVEKLKEMSEHTGKLKENLEALTSKTWTINVVYNETKQ